jgi:cytochrome P450
VKTFLFLADAATIRVQSSALRLMQILKRLAQEVTLSRARFPRPLQDFKPIKIFGPNILASEGEEWKRYRKMVAPAFSDVSL